MVSCIILHLKSNVFHHQITFYICEFFYYFLFPDLTINLHLRLSIKLEFFFITIPMLLYDCLLMLVLMCARNTINVFHFLFAPAILLLTAVSCAIFDSDVWWYWRQSMLNFIGLVTGLCRVLTYSVYSIFQLTMFCLHSRCCARTSTAAMSRLPE
jgi:hypothetical protein